MTEKIKWLSLFSSWSFRSSSYSPHLHQLKIWFLALIHVHWGMGGNALYMPFLVFVRVVTMRTNVKSSLHFVQMSLVACLQMLSFISRLFVSTLQLTLSFRADSDTAPFPMTTKLLPQYILFSLHFEFLAKFLERAQYQAMNTNNLLILPPFLLTEKANIFCCAFLVTPFPPRSQLVYAQNMIAYHTLFLPFPRPGVSTNLVSCVRHATMALVTFAPTSAWTWQYQISIISIKLLYFPIGMIVLVCTSVFNSDNGESFVLRFSVLPSQLILLPYIPWSTQLGQFVFGKIFEGPKAWT